jgi:hypothetical protein
MIKQIKEADGEWRVYDNKTMIDCKITKIEEYSIVPENEKKDKFRVDFKGKTVASMIPSFKEARKKAAEIIKNH